MLNFLAIVALSAIAVIGVPGQPNDTPTPERNSAAKSQPSVIPPNGNDKREKSEANEGKPNSSPPTGNTPVEGAKVWWRDSNWWLVIVAVGTACVIGWQSWETRQSADAGRKAAEVAFLNAQAVINAERARLLFEVEKSFDPKLGRGFCQFTIHAKNYGRTPAEVLGIIGPELTVVKNPYDLPLPVPPRPPFATAKRYIAPDEQAAAASFNPKSSTLIQKEARFAHETGVAAQCSMVYGEVRYKDGISDETRHSRYCFRFDREPFSNIGGSLIPDGPPDYNECT